MFEEGSWVVVSVNNRKFKGYIFEKGVYKSVVNVFVPAINDFSPHYYHNDYISPLPLETFDNEKELYLEASLLLACEDTFNHYRGLANE